MVQVLTRETIDEWARFTVNILGIFKKSMDSRIRRGSAFLWVRMEDLVCKCPKLKVDKPYLIMGNEHMDGQPGLMAGKSSVVIEWKVCEGLYHANYYNNNDIETLFLNFFYYFVLKDDWQEKVKALQRRARFCEDDDDE